jgi:hypothetical protein
MILFISGRTVITASQASVVAFIGPREITASVSNPDDFTWMYQIGIGVCTPESRILDIVVDFLPRTETKSLGYLREGVSSLDDVFREAHSMPLLRELC